MDLFQLLGTISIENADANKALDETSANGQKTKSKLSSAFSAIGKGALAVGKTIGAGLLAGGAAMGTLTVKALNLSGELEQNMGGSEQVFKEYADEMQKTAKEAFSNMGLSTSDFLGTANKMGALFQGAGFDIKTSATMSADAMQRAADVASIMGIDTSSAMEAIAGAAKGNFTMMDNLGVAMNDTTLQAFALSKGITKSTQDMTNQEKIGLAMEMFMEKTAYAAGNYARENQTLAGSLGTAKAALTNFLDGSGDVTSLVGAFENAANVIIKNVSEIAPRLISGLSELVTQMLPMIPPLLEKLLPVIIQGAVSLINGVVSALPMVLDILINSAIPQLLSGFTTIINTLISALPGIVTSFASALPTLIPMVISALVSIIVTICQQFGQIIQPIIDNLPVIIMSIVEALVSNFDILLQGIITLVLAIVSALPQIIQVLTDQTSTIIEMIVTALLECLPQLLVGIGQLIVGIAKALPTLLLSPVKVIVDTFKGIWTAVKNVFTNSTVGGFFKDVFNRAWTAIKNVFSNVGSFFGGIWNTIKDKFSAIGTKIGDAISGAVKSGINGLLGSAENIINGFLKMINGAIGLINKIPGVNIKKVDMVSFTRLAKGGVVDEPTPAVFGEDGAEAVVPLENNTGWLDRVANSLHDLMFDRNELAFNVSRESVELQRHQLTEMQMLNGKIDRVIGLLVQFFPEMLEALNIKMYLNDDVLVAQTASKFDTALGMISVKRGRGR